ncbi:MAG TPA: GNAT family N-acetyltransferase, partial [Burkholderiaceae bacterium]|nr:GNAT family N-acetyltransferase [Burkholderiaceae bacterium]
MLNLTPRADLGVMYEADVARYKAAGKSEITGVVTKEAFMRFYQGCPSVGFRRDGRDIGGLIFDGEEAHIAVLPEHHGYWGMLLKPALDWLFSQTAEAIVEVERDNDRCLRFIRHVGWERVGERGGALLFRLVALPGTR